MGQRHVFRPPSIARARVPRRLPYSHYQLALTLAGIGTAAPTTVTATFNPSLSLAAIGTTAQSGPATMARALTLPIVGALTTSGGLLHAPTLTLAAVGTTG